MASVEVTVTGSPTSSSTPFSYTDTENGTPATGTGTATNGSAATIANGMTITFNASTTYVVGDTYTVQMGVLPTTAVVLRTASGSVAAQRRRKILTNGFRMLTNNTSSVTSTSATSYGTAVKFITTTALHGIGSFTVVPGATITWNTSQVWAASYVANAQYTIASGP